MADLWAGIARAIAVSCGRVWRAGQRRAVGGGSINEAYHVSGEPFDVFVKLNRADLLPMFEAEIEGLREMASTATIGVPEPITAGVSEGRAFIAMEYLSLGGRGDGDRAGRALAAMHRIHQTRFGWHRDNTIGSTAQINEPDDDWVTFYRDRRLRFQYDLAERNGFGGRLRRDGERLMAELGVFFQSYQPEPSLLHGDLWAGNFAYTHDGAPVIFDPACYHGDREADLAMTELFGGFGGGFRQGYDEQWPLDPGYSVRKTLYNLYHILNHLNLFGGGYLGQAETMTSRLLSEL